MKNIQHCNMRFLQIGSYQYAVKIRGNGKPIICFHGFSEDHTTWEAIELDHYTLYCIDFIGHGASDRPCSEKAYQLDFILEQIHTLVQKLAITNYSLMGYSMGGRIALAYAFQYGSEIDKLILESSAFGIADESERINRKKSDKELAEKIMKYGIDWFQRYWTDLKIFDSQKMLPAAVQEKIKYRRLNNSQIALKNTLLGCGQGSLPYYGDKLSTLSMPILYISGALDLKYSQIGTMFAASNRHTVLQMVENAGHNVHLEKSNEFMKLVNVFLENTRRI